MRIRAATTADTEFILAITPRMVECGPLPGRDPKQMVRRDRDVLLEALERPSVDTAVFVAEDDDGAPQGFVHLNTDSDYYSNSTTAHVADLVVAAEADGRGVGSALIAHAEAWARQRGFALLTLNVVVENHRARKLYERVGFQEEWIRCIKPL